jgi:acetolactate synthase-1/2/3 large subunit
MNVAEPSSDASWRESSTGVDQMTGAQALISTLIAGGVEVCFTNPGTSEMHIVAALDRLAKMRCVLGLFEGVVTGAADGYARMAGKPACTLLHLGPGLANGLANLHNASRARVPIINIVGQHASHHLRLDSPLKSDIEAVARPWSKWLRTTWAAADTGRDAVAAILASRTAPQGIATLIVPADAAWSDGGAAATVGPISPALAPSAAAVERAAVMLRSGLPTALLLAGSGLFGPGLAVAGRIAAGTGAKLLAPYPFARMERGAGRSVVDRIPYVPEQAADLLKGFRQLILAGTEPPISYFAYPGRSSVLAPEDCVVHTLSEPSEDCAATLIALADALSLTGTPPLTESPGRPALPDGSITPPGLAATVAALLPEDAIVVDESMTSGRGIMAAARGGPHHDWLANTGGSIGIALPLAVGAAVACPSRRVLCLTADGSGMYTLQALWTIARESLNVTTVVFANRSYAVLKREFLGLGAGQPGPVASDLFDIGSPPLDWVSLAKGTGLSGTRADSLSAFARALQAGFESDGPTLIEVSL